MLPRQERITDSEASSALLFVSRYPSTTFTSICRHCAAQFLYRLFHN